MQDEGAPGDQVLRKVELRFESFQEFVDRYRARVSEEGMFLETGEPLDVGSRVRFDVRLSDEFRLLRGTGEVVWKMDPGTSSDWTPGMAIRFHEVDEPSHRLIESMMQRCISEGGTPFSLVRWAVDDLGLGSADRRSAAEDVLTPPPASGRRAPERTAPVDRDEPTPVPPEPEPPAPKSEVLATPPKLKRPREMTLDPVEPPPVPKPPAATKPAPVADSPRVEETPREPELRPPSTEQPGELPGAAPPRIQAPVRPAKPAAERSPDLPTPPEPAAEPAELELKQAPKPDRAQPPKVEPEGEGDRPPPAATRPSKRLTLEGWDDLLEPLESAPAPPAEPEPAEPPLIIPLPESPPAPPPVLPAESPEAATPAARPAEPVDPPPTAAPASEGAGGLDEFELVSSADEEPAVPRPTPESVQARAAAAAGLPIPVAATPTPEPGPTAQVAGVSRRRRRVPPWWRLVALLAVLGGVVAAGVYLRGNPLSDSSGAQPSTTGTSPAVDASPGPTAPQPAGEEIAAAVGGEGEPAPSGSSGEPQPQPQPESELETAPPPATAAQEEGTGPLTGIDRLSWEVADGETVLILFADGKISPEGFDHFRLADGSPRVVVRVLGVERAFAPERIAVGSAEIERVRVGLHRRGDRLDLHFVADLADPAVRIADVEVRGTTLRVRFAGG